MNATRDGLLSSIRAALGIGRAAAIDVGHHWVMACFSLLAGFGVWFAIQDVENPRVERTVPVNQQPVAVQAVNVPEGFIFVGQSVLIRVEAREADIESLVADHFTAQVDLSGIDPARESSVAVKVSSRKDNVRAIEAVPQSINVLLVPAVSREVKVEANYSGTVPDGYELRTNETVIEPAFVKVTGTQEQLDQVAAVEIDVGVSGRRDSGTVEGDLVARTESGNTVTVSIDPPRAKVTLKVAQTFTQRTLPVVAQITGHPAPGFWVAGISYDPETVQVTGPQSVMSGLTRIEIEPVDIGGAATNVTQTRAVVRVPNTSTDRTTVIVRVEIRPFDCSAGRPSSQCPTAAFSVGVTLTNTPPGYTFDQGLYQTTVRVSGSATTIATLKPEDFKATASLVAGLPGRAEYIVAVTAPTGIRIDGVDPVIVTLKAIGVP